MKGTYRRFQNHTRGLPHRTNFDEWSDPLVKRIRRKTKGRLTNHEQRSRLDKFNSKTGYCQTGNEVDNIRLMVAHGEPLLPQKEIRHLRLPIFTGLVLNLKDDGYPATSEYIKELVVLDDMFSKHDPQKALLRSNKTVLDKLAEGLKLAEDAKKKGHTTGEVEGFMDLASYFISSESSFYWLAEELLEQGVSLLNNPEYPVDPKVEAIFRFVYSSFLLDIQHDLVKSKIQLQLSMKLSIGKNVWLINDDGVRGEVLYLKSCVLLSKITLEEAYEQKDIDIDEAILCCRNSLHWAQQANNKPAISIALLTLAEFYLAANKLSHIYDILQQHIKLCKDCSFYRDLCEGYVMLSKYHETVGNEPKVVKVIEELILFALDKGILDIVMKAHLKLAEIYAIRRMGKMLDHATAAFKYAKLVGSEQDIELAKCLVGIGQGDQLYSSYIKLVSFAYNEESTNFKTLFHWKAHRILDFHEDNNILYHPEIDENVHIIRELERLKEEEINSVMEEKHLKVLRTSTRLGQSYMLRSKLTDDRSTASSLRSDYKFDQRARSMMSLNKY